MALKGIDAVVFGVAEMAEAKRFLDDWGVTEVSVSEDKLVYRTRDNTQVIILPRDAKDLPPAVEDRNTVREVIWGAADEKELEETLTRIRHLKDFHVGTDGVPRITDPNGLSLAFRVSQRTPTVVKPTMPDAPGTHQRINLRSPVHERVSHQYWPHCPVRCGFPGNARVLY